MMLRRALTVAALGFAVVGSAHAQTADENRDADALAADMRLLAANPLDIEALILAGELTLKMGDNTAAAGFFGRAERLDPLNPRVKAGWGALMLRSERPGEALRRFQAAEARGLNPSKFAADRGLAFDLVGEQERAQRDYRLALQGGPDDEVTRRYALSLGISGRKELAFKLLDPLLRRGDRAAWRDRAFILAMSGDTEGAQKIANTMMSPGLGAGLTPFFQRLPMLSPADRAFAVTFGEVRATPERTADAKLVPPLPKLGPDPYAPREVAVAAPVKVVPVEDGRKRKKRKNNDLAQVAPAPAPPVEVALTPPSYVAPRPVPTPGFTPPVSTAATQPRPWPTPAPPPVKVAEAPKPVIVTRPAPVPPPVKVVEQPKPVPVPEPVKVAEQPKPAPVPAPAPTPSSVVVASNTAPKPPEFASATPVSAPATPASAIPSDPKPGVADQPSAAEAGVSEQSAAAKIGGDTVLAKIVFDLASSGTGPAAAPTPATAPAPAQVPEKPRPKPEGPKARPTEAPKAEAKPVQTPRVKGKQIKGEPVVDPKSSKTAKGGIETADADDVKGKDAKGRGATSKEKDEGPALDKNGCPLPEPKGSAAAKGKSASAKKTKVDAVSTKGRSKVPARCKTADAKDKADAVVKGEPARIWVQVAGGANQAALEKAWAGLKTKAPELFRGRQGWATPLRNTNRVLTGPFKSSDDAQAFVNQLSKAGLSGFVFTSTKGQKIDRLGSR